MSLRYSFSDMHSWLFEVWKNRKTPALILHFLISEIHHLILEYIKKFNIRIHYILYTGKFSPPFYFRPFRPLTWGRIQNWANWIMYKGWCSRIEERANSRLGKSVLDLCRAKIRLDEFKAVYSMKMNFYY